VTERWISTNSTQAVTIPFSSNNAMPAAIQDKPPPDPVHNVTAPTAVTIEGAIAWITCPRTCPRVGPPSAGRRAMPRCANAPAAIAVARSSTA
jgi:hypothetical protein